MGTSLGKSHSGVSYGMPRRQRTVPNENSNHFSKDYWENTQGGIHRSTVRPEYWMVGSEKQYRDEVFKNKTENVYSKSNSLYQRTPGSFDSPFSPSSSKQHVRASSVTNRGATVDRTKSHINAHLALNAILSVQSFGSSAVSSRSSGSTTPVNRHYTPPHPPINNCYSSLHQTSHCGGSVYNSYSKYVPPCKF